MKLEDEDDVCDMATLYIMIHWTKEVWPSGAPDAQDSDRFLPPPNKVLGGYGGKL